MENKNRIKKLRQERGLTVQELADMVGKNRATVYRYENGDIENMPAKVLQDLADVLETTPAYLMGWTEDPYDYDLDSESVLSDVPDAVRRELLSQGKSPEEIYKLWGQVEVDSAKQSYCESTPTEDQIKAAFFADIDPALTEEDMDTLWDEAKEFIAFKLQQRKRKEI